MKRFVVDFGGEEEMPTLPEVTHPGARSDIDFPVTCLVPLPDLESADSVALSLIESGVSQSDIRIIKMKLKDNSSNIFCAAIPLKFLVTYGDVWLHNIWVWWVVYQLGVNVNQLKRLYRFDTLGRGMTKFIPLSDVTMFELLGVDDE
jgi:hypothetical protein